MAAAKAATNPQGTIGPGGEAAAATTLRLAGRSVVNTNRPDKKNFPLVDLMFSRGEGIPTANDTGFASVKTRGVHKQRSLSEQDLRQYRTDFTDITTRPEAGFPAVPAEKAAREVAANRASLQASGAWPADLRKNASIEAITTYVNEKGILMVVDDHVGAIRDDIAKNPDKYGLAAGPGRDKRIKDLQARVQGMGMRAAEVNEVNERVFK